MKLDKRLTKLIFVFVFLSFFVTRVYALSVKNVIVNSKINDMLDAEIHLKGTSGLSDGDVYSSIASLENFKRAKLDYPTVLNNVIFTTKKIGKGELVIHVKSLEPIKISHMNFLLDIRWPKGRVFKEITFLLDPPLLYDEDNKSMRNFSDNELLKIPYHAISNNDVFFSKTDNGDIARGKEFSEVPAGNDIPMDSQGSTYYTVSKGDTLSEISNKMVLKGLTLEQAIIAVYNKNPDAFIKDNVNLIKNKHVLKMPTHQEVSNINHNNAVWDIAEHNKKWRNINRLNASKNARDFNSLERPQIAGDTAKLTIATAKSDLDNGTDSVASLRGDSENMVSGYYQEEIEAVKRENVELVERIKSLDKQLETLSELLQVKDAGLARLQEEMRSLSDSNKDLQEQLQALRMSEKKGNIVSSDNFLVTLFLNWWWMLLLIASGGLFARYYLTKQKSNVDYSSDDVHVDEVLASIDANIPHQEVSVPWFNKIKDLIKLIRFRKSETVIADVQEFSEDGFSLSNDLEVEDIIEEINDCIMRNDFLQAIDVAKSALDKLPDNKELNMKLLYLYVHTKNQVGFNEVLENLDDEKHVEIKNYAKKLSEKLVASDNEASEVVLDGEVENQAQSPVDSSKGNQYLESFNLDENLEPEELDLNNFEFKKDEEKLDTDSEMDTDLELDTDSGMDSDLELGSSLITDSVSDLASDADQLDEAGDITEDIESNTTLELAETGDFDPMLSGMDGLEKDLSVNEDLNSTDEEGDEVDGKLALVKAYIDMGDVSGAEEVLDEIELVGNEQQKIEAQELRKGL